MIKWYGAFKIENGKTVAKILFPKDRRAEILKRIRMGDLSDIKELGDGEVRFEGEIKSRREMIDTAIELARMEMKNSLGEDYILIEMLNTYDDIVSTLNLLTERIIEWDKIREIKGEDQEVANILQEEIKRLEILRDEISKNIEFLANSLCPNLSHLVGTITAARLIASAGGLERLSKLPASTIQVLGAEEAFFRHLKLGAKCPKHGIIFRVPIVRNSPKKVRGKISRTLASKIAIAARVDYYGGKFVGDMLKEELQRRVEEIKNDSHRKQKRG